MTQKRPSQEFDNTLKALFGSEAKEILPKLVPDTTLVDDKNIEINRTILKADLVYNVIRNGLPHILNMELQTGADSDIDIRVLQYHVGLYAKYKKPVLTVILYPFEAAIPTPPFEEKSGEEVLLSLQYRVVALWELDAQECVQEHVLCLYTLLPAMKGATAALLIEALHEMKAYYARLPLGHHLIRFKRIMQRSKILSEPDKQLVKEELRMNFAYDWFIDDNPDVQERVAKGELRGELRGEQRGELRMGQKYVLQIIKNRFPALVELAQQHIAQIENQNELEQLHNQLLAVSNEGEARKLLKLSVV